MNTPASVSSVPAEPSDADKVTKSIGSVLLSYRPTSKGRHLVFCSIRTPGAVGNSSHVTSKMRATGRKALPRSGFCYLVA